jgi:uncharacterized protein YbaR (Trm112 family)/SAM-dependent methyltransferase
MKRRLLELLCCPMCEGDVTLTAFREDGEQVTEGMLACAACRRTFPIINSIPRMLPDPLAHLALKYHAEFFDRYPEETAGYRERCRPVKSDRWWRAEERTVRSYSYQWRKFKQMFDEWEQVFLDSIRPVTPDFFRGRVGLDGGCGFGRSLFYAATYGAEMIGLDLSEAIEAARENTRQFEKVHLVQGDIFHPPVKRRALDFVYSIGVLHHLPDPKGGFRSLTRLLKPGAPMFVWVYLRGRGRQIAAFTVMRAISTRLPVRVVSGLSLGLAVGQWLMWIAPYRVMKAVPGLSRAADRLPFTFYARYPFRALHTDWVDGLTVPLQNYHRPEEVAEWYREAGLVDVHIEPDWNGRALGYAVRSEGAGA